MKIVEWDGLHYCADCGALTVNEDYDSIEYCEKCAKKRGWNFFNRRRVKVPNETDDRRPNVEGTPSNGTGQSETQTI